MEPQAPASVVAILVMKAQPLGFASIRWQKLLMTVVLQFELLFICTAHWLKPTLGADKHISSVDMSTHLDQLCLQSIAWALQRRGGAAA